MIPTPERVTPQWLTEQLHQAGYDDAQVAGISRTSIGTGQIGQCVRYAMTFAAETDAPSTLVGKFPSDDPISRGTGVALRNYYREVRFYQTLAHDVNINIPKCYFADIVEEGPEFCLLLEDMAPAAQGDQLKGCSPEVAAAAVVQLAGLQAPHWCDPQLKSIDWLNPQTNDPIGDGSMLYQQTLPGFVDRYGHALAPDQIDIIAKVAESPNCPIFVPPSESMFCLEHVDYRLDNMLIHATAKELKVTVVDWQSIKLGKPLNDVGYFLGAGLVPETRREVEQEIVRRYYDALIATGIDGPSWDACWEEYRRATFSGFAVTVIAAMLVQQTERGDQMFITMADRHSRHALDLGAEEFLR